MRRFTSLRRRADFARIRRRGRRATTRNLVVYRSESQVGDASSLVGIAVSKSIGKAVIRNKVRRRLAAILHDALASRPPMRVLVVARPIAATAEYRVLAAELASALAQA